MKIIDDYLDTVSMYKLLVWGLSALSCYSLVLSILKLNGLPILNSIFTLFVLIISGLFFQHIFSKLWNAPSNIDSTIISILIVFLIVAPVENAFDILSPQGYLLPIILSFCVVASKYLLQLNKTHIWNPAVFAIIINSFFLNGFNIWQVGSIYMFVPVCVFAYLILRKQKLFYLFFTYLFFSLIISGLFNLENVLTISFLKSFFLSSPIIFFASVMLTEPTTLPDRKYKRYIYAFFVSIVANTPFSLSFFPALSTSPEIALFIANIFSYFTSFRKRIILRFVENRKIAENTYEFIFNPDQKVNFVAGQYAELTLQHKNADTRGIRRYFTIASAPIDKYIKFGIRISPKDGSSFKKALLNLKENESVLMSSISGDFVLSQNKNDNIVCIAGGIGVTPFIAFLKSDKNLSNRLTLFNFNKTEVDISYREELKMLEFDGVKIINILGSFLTQEILSAHLDLSKEKIDNYRFYISGPPKMVENYEAILVNMGIKTSKIMTDYFPGYN